MSFSPSTASINRACRQQGGSLPGLLLGIVIALFLVSIAFKMVPHYMDYKVIQKSIEGLESNTTVAASVKTPGEFYTYMQKSMELNGIRDIKAKDIMEVARNGNQFVIQIDYERREPMIKNLSLIAHFKKELSVRIP